MTIWKAARTAIAAALVVVILTFTSYAANVRKRLEKRDKVVFLSITQPKITAIRVYVFRVLGSRPA
jgi:hypothetical protein